MDLTKFKERYPEFLRLMKERGYYNGYIEKFDTIARLILKEGEDDSIETYEQFYYHMVESHKHTDRTNNEYKNLIGRLKVFVEEDVFLGDTGAFSGFLDFKTYDHLSPSFKQLIDGYIKIERRRGKLKESTIAAYASCTASFLYFIQQMGITTLSGIKCQQIVLQAFSNDQKTNRGHSVAKAISIVFKNSIPLYPDGVCRKILGMIPEFPKRTRIYDYLQPEENDLVLAALEGRLGNLTYRTKAIGTLAYFTGMRRIDIANLRFENISLENEEISFIQQKTGLKTLIPLRPLVGNAIYDYIAIERPKCDSDYIFIRSLKPFVKLSPQRLTLLASEIFKVAGIRQEKGRRQGLHIFRHAFASDLVAQNVPNSVVSELLGHASLKSISPYLDADTEHLRECALSIEGFSDIASAYIEPFFSIVRKDIQKFVDHNMEQGTWCSNYNRMLRFMDNYFITHFPDATFLSQQMLNQWGKPLNGESRQAYLERMDAARDFIQYLSDTNNSAIVMPKLDNIDLHKITPLPKTYSSVASDLLRQFVSHRKTSGRWSDIYDRNLRSFDMHCATLYPKETTITQEMVDTWSAKRQTENSSSWGKRIAVVNSFIKYTSKRGLLDLKWNSIPHTGQENIVIKEPHIFTDVELSNFFYACDHIQISRFGLVQRLMQLIIPVFFRLLYSSGMRTNEARNLDREDVDLSHGVINIHRSKGYTEHRIALHPTMQERLIEYDKAVNRLVPDRKCFFPNYKDKHYSLIWMDYNFSKLWYKFNYKEATSYHLRHHYATTNINSWPAQAEKFNRNLLYLSRSMGHSTLEITMYYYHFTPKLAEILKARKAGTFNEIISNHTKISTDEY